MSSKRLRCSDSLNPAAIPDLPVENCRPFSSVMIPTYNPRADHFEETLWSVLKQDPDQMQIEVIDDASPNGAPTEFIRELAGQKSWPAGGIIPARPHRVRFAL